MKFLKSLVFILSFMVIVLWGYTYNHLRDLGLMGIGFTFGFIYIIYIGGKEK